MAHRLQPPLPLRQYQQRHQAQRLPSISSPIVAVVVLDGAVDAVNENVVVTGAVKHVNGIAFDFHFLLAVWMSSVAALVRLTVLP